WKDSTCPPHRVRLRREADVLLNENKRNLIVGDIFLKILDQMKSFRANEFNLSFEVLNGIIAPKKHTSIQVKLEVKY
ncbi:MAG: hypothetical protein AAF849_04685, partial [Bacteroidota bacterium]